jgi:hypothetical protein
MKKFILPLLLLLAIGMLAAVESDPSAVVGYVKYECVAGNNTIALPMVDAYEYASEIGDVLGATSIGYFDNETQLWTLIDAFPWGGWTDEFPVVNGQPLWVYVDFDTEFYSIGSLPATQPSYELVAGNNTIMLPLNRADLEFASLVGDEIGATTVGYFDSATQLWTLVDAFPWGGWTDEFDTAIGDPLWIYTDFDSTWPAPIRAQQNIKTKSK